jgi:hypothetical protein
MKSFLKKVGSNRVLRAQTVTVTFKKPASLLAQTVLAVQRTPSVSELGMHRDFLAVNNSEFWLKTMKHGGFGCEHQNGLFRDFLALSALRLKELRRMPVNGGDVEGERSFLRVAICGG